ncbi:MAG: zinc-binding dehydrogenase [Deltaproteobacteria bacterium]|nr:zinc-binding dehydrogenase [Deltaproteobacteria bacterium]
MFIQTLFALLTHRQHKLAKKAQARFRYMFMHPDGDQLAQFAKWIDAGELSVGADKAFAMVDFKDAFELLESGQAKGKVILAIGA